MNLNLVYVLCMIACGLCTAFVPFVKDYWILASMSGTFGFAIAANYSLTSPILVELVSLEQFSSAYGTLLLIQGVSNLIGPPLAGFMYDVTQEWWLTFGVSGGFIVWSGLLLFTLPCLRRLGLLKAKVKVSQPPTSVSSATTLLGQPSQAVAIPRAQSDV